MDYKVRTGQEIMAGWIGLELNRDADDRLGSTNRSGG